MSERWAVCVDSRELAGLGRLRGVPQITVCEMRNSLWLLGESLDEAVAPLLRALPGARRFSVQKDEQLLEHGKRVPGGYLPKGPWQPLSEWLSVCLAPAAIAGRVKEPVRVQLTRSHTETEPGVLLTSLDAWKTYGTTAPRIRLDCWSFALNEGEEVVVWGQPVPPIWGQRFVECEGVAVPVGWTWSPAVEPAVMRTLLGIAGKDLALLHPEGTWDRVPAASFVRATRSGIRLSGKGDTHAG